MLLLERRQLTCGTTWHAAGLIGQLRATQNLTRLAKYSAELYAGLEAETGQPTGFRQHGSLRLARTAERFIELKRAASMAATFGLEVECSGPAEAKARHPLLAADDVVGGGVHPLGRPGQPDRHHPGAGQGRADAAAPGSSSAARSPAIATPRAGSPAC